MAKLLRILGWIAVAIYSIFLIAMAVTGFSDPSTELVLVIAALFVLALPLVAVFVLKYFIVRSKRKGTHLRQELLRALGWIVVAIYSIFLIAVSAAIFSDSSIELVWGIVSTVSLALPLVAVFFLKYLIALIALIASNKRKSALKTGDVTQKPNLGVLGRIAVAIYSILLIALAVTIFSAPIIEVSPGIFILFVLAIPLVAVFVLKYLITRIASNKRKGARIGGARLSQEERHIRDEQLRQLRQDAWRIMPNRLAELIEQINTEPALIISELKGVGKKCELSEADMMACIADAWQSISLGNWPFFLANPDRAEVFKQVRDSLALDKSVMERPGAAQFDQKLLVITAVLANKEQELPGGMAIDIFNAALPAEKLIWLEIAEYGIKVDRTMTTTGTDRSVQPGRTGSGGRPDSWSGDYSGVSIGTTENFTSEHARENVELKNRGFLGITDQHIYFSESDQYGHNFRLRYDQIVSLDHDPGGITVVRDAPGASPEIFITGDGQFLRALVTNLSGRLP